MATESRKPIEAPGASDIEVGLLKGDEAGEGGEDRMAVALRFRLGGKPGEEAASEGKPVETVLSLGQAAELAGMLLEVLASADAIAEAEEQGTVKH